MCGLKFMYEAPNQTAANQITLNWTMRSQTKACITKLPCSCRILHSTKWQFIPGVSEPINPSFKGQEIKKTELSTTEVNFFFWGGGFFHHLISWRCTMFWNLDLFLFSGKAPNLVHPLDWAILSHWVPQKQEHVEVCIWQ